MAAKRYIFLIIALLTSVLVNAQEGSIRVSRTFADQTLPQVLAALEKDYDLHFAYDSYALSDFRGSWEFKDEELRNVLDKLLDPHELAYRFIDDTIVIFRKEEEVQQSSEGNESPPADSFIILGEVRDIQSRELLPFAVITAMDGSTGTTTDVDGKFSIVVDAASKDSLEIFYVGYEEKKIALANIAPGAYLKIRLSAGRNYLPPVMIEALKVRLVETSDRAGIQTINPNNIATSQGTGEMDVLRAVQLLPGISATQESSNGLYIRGSNSDQTLITLDGFTLYQQDHFLGAFTAVNSNAVKTMRVHKGAMDARFGGRTAGLLEIIGKEGSLKKTSAQIDLGALSVGAVIEAPLDTAGKASVIITGRRSFTSSIYSPTYRNLFNTVYNASVTTSPENKTQTFGGVTDPDFYFQDANVKFTYRPSERDVINITGFAAKDELFVQYADTANTEVENLTDRKYNDESTKKNAGAGIRWGHRINERWDGLFTAGLSQLTGSYFSADTIHQLLFDTDSVSFTSNNTTLSDLDSRVELNRIKGTQKWNFGVELNRMETSDKKNFRGNISSEYKRMENVFSGYAQDEIAIGQRMLLRAGLRINYFSGDRNFYAEPRLSLTQQIIPGVLSLKISAGRIHQYIQRVRSQSLYLNTPDYWKLSAPGDLPVLRSDQVMGGFTVREDKWTVDVEGYYKKNEGNITNVGIYASALTSVSPDSIIAGKGEAYGMDVFLQRDFRRSHTWISYSLLKAESKFSSLDATIIPEFFEQRHEVKLYYEMKFRRYDFSVLGVYGSGRPYTPLLGTYDFLLPDGSLRTLPVYGNLNSARLPAYHRVDIALAYNFVLGKMKGKLMISAFNIYNRQNVRDIQYLAVRAGNDPYDYKVAERKVNMLGFLPTINLQLRF